jgi:hypothetical protein
MQNDLLMLASKVLTRAMEKSGYAGPALAAGLDGGHGAEQVIDALATHLLTLLGIGGTAGAPPPTDLERICAEQMARNNAVARALGACDCWGDLAACEACRGRGVPGWRPPDRASFDVLVRPVLRKMKQHRLRVHGAPAVSL